MQQSSWDALERPDPSLTGRLAHTNASPRVVAVCLMHRLAHLAPTQPDPQHTDCPSPEDAAAAGITAQ